jgi:hypothetical protein
MEIGGKDLKTCRATANRTRGPNCRQPTHRNARGSFETCKNMPGKPNTYICIYEYGYTWYTQVRTRIDKLRVDRHVDTHTVRMCMYEHTEHTEHEHTGHGRRVYVKCTYMCVRMQACGVKTMCVCYGHVRACVCGDLYIKNVCIRVYT